MRRFFLTGGLGLLLTLALAACGSGVPKEGSGQGLVEPITESDEPDTMRRARIRTELASGYFEQGQTTVALDEIKQALAADPNYAPAYNLRGLIYMRMNEVPLAESSFLRAIQLAPKDPDVRHNYGWMLCQLERYAPAQAQFELALSAINYPNAARTWLAQGVCQGRAGQNAAAERSLARSFELDPGNPITAFTLARLLHQRGEHQRAQFYVQRLNSSEFANAETLWLGVQVERRLNNIAASRLLGEQLRRRFPQSREATAYERGAFDE